MLSIQPISFSSIIPAVLWAGRVTFRLIFSTPIPPSSIDRAPYDPYIYVYNTGYDIHLIGEDPLPGSGKSSG